MELAFTKDFTRTARRQQFSKNLPQGYQNIFCSSFPVTFLSRLVQQPRNLTVILPHSNNAFMRSPTPRHHLIQDRAHQIQPCMPHSPLMTHIQTWDDPNGKGSHTISYLPGYIHSCAFASLLSPHHLASCSWLSECLLTITSCANVPHIY